MCVCSFMGFKINFIGIIAAHELSRHFEWAQIKNFKQLCVQMSKHILLIFFFFFFFYLLLDLTENDF